MEEPTIRRITVERESDWLIVQENIGKGLQKSLDARLATLPGGRDGPAAKGVKRELEERIKKVRRISCSGRKQDIRLMIDPGGSVQDGQTQFTCQPTQLRGLRRM
jgi:hypothetical protein